MVPYTLPIPQTDSQLRQLIERTRQSQQPIVFTTETTEESVAVLVESSVFEELQKYKRQLFHLRVKELQRQLDRLTEVLPDPHLREPVIADFRSGAEALWQISPEQKQGLCVTLIMASRRLKARSVRLEQITALQQTLALFRNETTDDAAFTHCYEQLIACGLPPMMSGSKELAKLYEDEL